MTVSGFGNKYEKKEEIYELPKSRVKLTKGEGHKLSSSKSSFVPVRIDKNDLNGTFNNLLKTIDEQTKLKKPGEVVGVFLNQKGDKYNVKIFNATDRSDESFKAQKLTNTKIEKQLGVLNNEEISKKIHSVFNTIGQDTDKSTALQQVLYSNVMVPKSRESILSLAVEEEHLKWVLKNDLPKLREIVRTEPGVLRSGMINKEFLNDPELIRNALLKDPTACLLAGPKLKQDTASYGPILLSGITYLSLGKYPAELRSKKQDIATLAKTLFPEKEVDNTVIGSIMGKVGQLMGKSPSDTPIETIMGKVEQLVMRGSSSDDEGKKLKSEIQSDLSKIPYSDWVTALNNIKNNRSPGNAEFLLIGLTRLPLSFMEMVRRFGDYETLTKDFDRLSLDKMAEFSIKESMSRLTTLVLNSNDKDVVRFAVQYHPNLILHADESIQFDPEFKECFIDEARKTILQSPSSFTSPSIPLALKKDVVFICSLLEKKPQIYGLLDLEMRTSKNDQIFQAVLKGLRKEISDKGIYISFGPNGELLIQRPRVDNRGERRTPALPISDYIKVSCGAPSEIKDDSILTKIQSELFNDQEFIKAVATKKNPKISPGSENIAFYDINPYSSIILAAPSSIQMSRDFKELFFEEVLHSMQGPRGVQLNVIRALGFPKEVLEICLGYKQDEYVYAYLCKCTCELDESLNLIITDADGKKTTLKEIQEKFLVAEGITYGDLFTKLSTRKVSLYAVYLNLNPDYSKVLLPFATRELELNGPYFGDILRKCLKLLSTEQQKDILNLLSGKQESLKIDPKPLVITQEMMQALGNWGHKYPKEVGKLKKSFLGE